MLLGGIDDREWLKQTSSLAKNEYIPSEKASSKQEWRTKSEAIGTYGHQ